MENGIPTHRTPERDLTLYNLQEGDPTIPLPHRLSQKQTAHSPASSTPKTGLRSTTAASGTLAVTHTRHTGRSPTNSLPARSGARGLPDARTTRARHPCSVNHRCHGRQLPHTRKSSYATTEGTLKQPKTRGRASRTRNKTRVNSRTKCTVIGDTEHRGYQGHTRCPVYVIQYIRYSIYA